MSRTAFKRPRQRKKSSRICNHYRQSATGLCNRRRWSHRRCRAVKQCLVCRFPGHGSGDADFADAAAEEFFDGHHGLLDFPLGVYRRGARAVGIQCPIRFCRLAWRDCAGWDDHAQLGHIGRSNRARYYRGASPWTAIIEATVRRSRPVALTAAAAILAMIPLTRSAFWGPMAMAIMGGLVAATFLTVLFFRLFTRRGSGLSRSRSIATVRRARSKRQT